MNIFFSFTFFKQIETKYPQSYKRKLNPKMTTTKMTLVKFYINDTDFDIVNLDEWEILEADHEDNEWDEPIYYCWKTERSMTFDYIKENTFCG